MNKSDVSRFFHNMQIAISKHSPEILVGVGIAGMVTTTILAVRSTPKALQLIEEAKEEKGENLTPVETVKAAWKCYIPATATCVLSVACLISASSVNARRNAALATAYKISETALSEYREKVVDTIGEKKEQSIRDAIDKDHIEKNPVNSSTILVTSKGNTRCFDYHSGRYFTSDIDHIKKAVNELNRRMILDMYVSLNEFYDELDLEHTQIGDELGWNLDDGLIEVDFGSQIDSEGVPCIVVNYHIAPKRNFNKFL